LPASGHHDEVVEPLLQVYLADLGQVLELLAGVEYADEAVAAASHHELVHLVVEPWQVEQGRVSDRAFGPRHLLDDLEIEPSVEEDWVALLRDYVDVVGVQVALEDLAQEDLLALEAVLPIVRPEELLRYHWLPRTTRVVLAHVAVGCTGHEGVDVTAAQELKVGVPDGDLEVELIVGEVPGLPDGLLGLVDVPEL